MPRKNRTYNKGPKGLTKTQTKAVATIAKKATLKVAETKSYISSSTRSPVSDLYYASNLIYPITQGTTSETVIGEKMFLKNIHIRLFYKTAIGLGAAQQTVRFMVVQAKKDFTNSHGTVSYLDLMRGVGGTPSVDFPDHHKVTILKKYEMVLNPSTTSGHVFVKDIYVPINANKTFQSDNSGYFKAGNYYLILHASDFSGLNTTGQFSFTWSVNYKDF